MVYSNINNKMDYYKIIPRSNIDTITTNGIYTITETPGLLLHENWDGTYAFQLLNNFGTETIKFREKTGNGWKDYKTVSVDGHTHSDIINEINDIKNETKYIKRIITSVNINQTDYERNVMIDQYTSVNVIVENNYCNLIFPDNDSFNALIMVNKGQSNEECGLLVMTLRNNGIYITTVKTLPNNITYNCTDRTLAIHMEQDTGIVTVFS